MSRHRSTTDVERGIVDAPITPERELACAVFLQALDDLDHYLPDIRQDAEEWVASDRTGSIYCFADLCANFELDRAAVRKALSESNRDSFRAFLARIWDDGSLSSDALAGDFAQEDQDFEREAG